MERLRPDGVKVHFEFGVGVVALHHLLELLTVG